ncbi:hypothetical protein [Paenibacillus sp. OK076]|uniref:hypothetical protein n=1 Tax=Paenibacillus sp. OK076 TaxID=1884379 RepID=UPI0008CD2C64|nr:hypothetical protein [Paenibacillus sp. OK076]SEP33267.1 hypothetical protein SAMN05518670_6586 [Paenibacillus sp. OK076]
MLNEKIIVRVRDHVPGYEGRTVGVAHQGDIFIFRNPIGHLSDAEYLTCFKLGRSDFVEPFKRSTELQWIEQEEKYQVYLNKLSERFMPILEAYWREDGVDKEIYWSMMEKQGIESHCSDLMLFNRFLWRKARELEEKEPSNVRRIDQVYEMIKCVGKIFEVRAGHSSIETDSIYFQTEDSIFWHGC